MVQFYLRALLARGEPGDNASRSAMFDASDLETGEVRSLFVTPLMTEICHRFGLSEEAKLLGIDTLPASGNGGDDIFVDISTHSGVTTRRAEVSCGWIYNSLLFVSPPSYNTHQSTTQDLGGGFGPISLPHLARTCSRCDSSGNMSNVLRNSAVQLLELFAVLLPTSPTRHATRP